MNPQEKELIRLIRSPFRFRVFLLSKLPSAYFAGVRVRELDPGKCVATVPYKWFSRNPFRSTYFACLSMAAEMTTGVLGMMQLYKRRPKVSMLVVKVESEYFKKATGRTRFTCEDGNKFRQSVEEAIQTGEARTVRARSVGHDKEGQLIAEFYVTWSFKAKQL